MTLLVADDITPSLTRALAADVVTVGAAEVGDALATDDPDVVLVDGTSVADLMGVVDAVREDAPDAVVVVVGARDGGDVSCATSDEQSVRAAVERAHHIAKYRESVSALYEACRGRALGRPDGDLREFRATADERFEDLPGDPEAVDAALRPTDDAKRETDAERDADEAREVDEGGQESEDG